MICPICKENFTPGRADQTSCGKDTCRQSVSRLKAKGDYVSKGVTMKSTPEEKAKANWCNVCTPEEWRTQTDICDRQAEQAAWTEIYNNYSAEELAAAGIKPPVWKKRFKTNKEVINSTIADLDKKGLFITTLDKLANPEPEDYSKWK